LLPAEDSGSASSELIDTVPYDFKDLVGCSVFIFWISAAENLYLRSPVLSASEERGYMSSTIFLTAGSAGRNNYKSPSLFTVPCMLFL